ncbi:WRKY transcription factor 22 [Hibiscus syriacus]|uniref:WRKY transcription factor 22 n=1 Tax=Hibiscus syriacus TaxID=106335 RepID=A0A6A2WRB9_HIBSY|nr:probable WRKY transcription factor 14 [Hibiscus syriacus]KAE8656890.1 WRKY transcription factor 22 [Hibiscus syriacus]
MESYRGEGDLKDIVRASGGDPLSCAADQDSYTVHTSSWHQFPSDPLNNFPSSATEGHGLNTFGDPFSSIRDPLLHEFSSTYFNSPNSAYHHHTINTSCSTTVEDTSSFPGSATIVGQSKMFEEDTRSPCNIFSRIQISPTSLSKLPVSHCDLPMMAATGVSPRGIKAPAVLPSDMINAKTTSKSSFIDNTGPVQISYPRNLGIKRRKSQVKKVVCIPAPAAANSRSSGEVVPSDLWAWRKYGQKPIKGSPYPRGYYRCSSSKGCSARKQVERSRTDPNMLVITYTSEHNHPWPTQRNALAGSTRSQPSKTSSASKINPKEEELKESSNDALSPTNAAAVSSTASASAKEESEDMEKQQEPDDAEFGDQGIPQTYIPPASMPTNSQQADDFFAELDEIETDPLNLLFPQRFSGADQDEQKETKTMDPFGLFNWPGNNNASF